MKRFLLLFVIFTLSACTAPSGTPRPETPSPASQAPAAKTETAPPLQAGSQAITFIPAEGTGKIAVRLTFPSAPRYPDGAGVVVDIATFFTSTNDFYEDLDAAPIGLIRIAYLYPGVTSKSTGVRSEGSFDYGGADSIAALREVIRFAAGQIPDAEGRFIGDLSPFPVLTENLGLYAFSHPGIAAVKVLAEYGDALPVAYFVGRENPTVDAISAMELGYWDEDHRPVVNPLYRYPQDYAPDHIALDYSSVRWGADIFYPQQPGYHGYPYFDINGNNRPDEGDFILSYKVPSMFGKRYYSAALTQALRENGLDAANWPTDVATPEEAAAAWESRITPPLYAALAETAPQLKVLLLFCRQGHVQPIPDRPQIHQAYDGLHGSAGLWTRLNPDAAYLPAEKFPGYQEHPANTEPQDWMQSDAWSYPPGAGAAALAAQGAVAEMADRVHENNWQDDLNAVLFPLTVSASPSAAAETEASTPSSSQSSAPLYVFYIVHAQVENDYAPYTEASMQQIDKTVMRAMSEEITRLAETAAAHGMPITWEFPQPLAQGLCSTPHQPSLLETLSQAGHEIAVYAHGETIDSAYRTLADCGFPPRTLGGLLIDATRAQNPQETLSAELRAASESGYDIISINLSPLETADPRRNTFARICNNQFGEGSQPWEDTGNLLYPWKPAYQDGNVCAADENGDLLFVDAVHTSWMEDANGRNVPVLRAENFAVLRGWLDAAIAWQEAHPSDSPAAWGFVSHMTEYTLQDDGSGAVDETALNALDEFLAYLEALQEEGKIRLVRVEDISTAAP